MNDKATRPRKTFRRRLIRNHFRGFQTSRKTLVSGYRAMWLIVCFDLPVGNKAEKRRATGFRNMLLDEGFTMKQFSVYQRYFENRPRAEAVADRIGKKVPPMGMVSILFLTDKQIGLVRNYHGNAPPQTDEKPAQLIMF